MLVVNTFRTSKGPPKFCIDLEADWLLILDKVGGKSPDLSQKLRTLQHKLTVIVFKEKFINLHQMMHLITKGFSDILNLC